MDKTPHGHTASTPMKPEIAAQSDAPYTRPPGETCAAPDGGSAGTSSPPARATHRSAARFAAGRRARIRVTRRIGASAERVFHAWLDPAIAGEWLFATAAQPMTRVEIDPRVAGTFRLTARRDDAALEYRGEYLEVVPHRRLAFTLAADDHGRVETRVTVDITPLPKGCALALTHDDVPIAHKVRTRARWIGILYGLGATLASAVPPRAGREQPI